MLELYVYTEMADGPDTEADVTFVPVATAAQVKDVQKTWANFDAVQCQAFNPADKDTIMGVIAASQDGIEGFNMQVQKLARTFFWTDNLSIDDESDDTSLAWPYEVVMGSPTHHGNDRDDEDMPLSTSFPTAENHRTTRTTLRRVSAYRGREKEGE